MAQALSSCATAIHEETFYTDAGDQGAVVSHFFDSSTSVMGKDAWDSIREGMTCESPDAIGEIKSEFEELCTKVSCKQVPLTDKKVSPEEMAALRKTVFQINSFLARISHARGQDVSH